MWSYREIEMDINIDTYIEYHNVQWKYTYTSHWLIPIIPTQLTNHSRASSLLSEQRPWLGGCVVFRDVGGEAVTSAAPSATQPLSEPG